VVVETAEVVAGDSLVVIEATKAVADNKNRAIKTAETLPGDKCGGGEGGT